MAPIHRNKRQKTLQETTPKTKKEEEKARIKALAQAKTVAIVGPTGAGKTWIQKFADSHKRCHSSGFSGAMMYPIDFKSNKGLFCCNMLDVPANIGSSLLDLILYGVDGIILLCDLQSPDPFFDISMTVDHIKGLKNFGDKPVVLCGNKVDVPNISGHLCASLMSKFARLKELNWYYEISTLANHKIVEPFLHVIELSVGFQAGDLQLMSDLKLEPPVKSVGEAQKQVDNAIANVLKGRADTEGMFSLKWQNDFVKQMKETTRKIRPQDDEIDF